MKYFMLALCLAALASCSTTKYVDRVRTVTDSTVLQQNEQLQELYASTVARYEKQLQDSSGVRVEFITDTMQLPGTVTIDRAGVLQAQGRIKSVQLSNTRLLRERGELSRMVDSLTAVKQKTEVRVETKTVTVEKKVKRGWPFWWLIIGLIAGWIARGYWPRVRNWVGFVAVLLICSNAGAQQFRIDTTNIPTDMKRFGGECTVVVDTVKCFLLCSHTQGGYAFSLRGYAVIRTRKGLCFDYEVKDMPEPVYLNDKKAPLSEYIIVWQHKKQNW